MHSVHLNPQFEGTEIACPQFSGGRFCQVVVRTGLTVLRLYARRHLTSTGVPTIHPGNDAPSVAVTACSFSVRAP